jgi:hypothetical protein
LLLFAALSACSAAANTGEPPMAGSGGAAQEQDAGMHQPDDSSVAAPMLDASMSEPTVEPDSSVGDASESEPSDGGEPPSFGLVAPEVIRVRRPGSVPISIKLERRGGFSGAVAVELLGLPANVSASPVTIGPAVTTATITLSARQEAAHGGPLQVRVRAIAVDDPTLQAEAQVELFVAGATGSPDESFSFDGSIDLDPSTGQDIVTSLAFTQTGDLVMSGTGQGPDPWIGWVVRLSGSGALDETFGDQGVLATFGADSSVQKVLPWGNSLVVAATDATESSLRRYVRMLDSTGEVEHLDINGDVLLPDSIDSLIPRSHDLIAHGNRFLVSVTPPGSSSAPFVAEHDFSTSWVRSAATDTFDRVIVGMTSEEALQIKRLRADGRVDDTFGVLGTLSYPLPEGHELARVGSIVTHPDGSGVALASSCYGGIYDCRVVALGFTASGTPDPNFGASGVELIGDPAVASRLFLQPDGRVLVAYGDKVDENTIDSKVKRLNPDGSTDAAFHFDLEESPSVFYEPAGHRLVLAYVIPQSGALRVTRCWL